MKGAFRCVPDPTFLVILYPDTRKSPTVGDGGVDGMTPTEKTQLLLICSFLPHPGLNSWAFPLACKSAKTTSPVTADQCQTPGDIRSFHFVPVDRGWWKVRGSWCLKILNQSISLTGQCSFFILSASSISAGSATPPPQCLLSVRFFAVFWLMLTIDQQGWRCCFPVAREGTEAQGGGSDVGAGIQWCCCAQKGCALSTALWRSSYERLHQQLLFISRLYKE